MKKILTLLLVSALGGFITLGAYKMFLEEEQTTVLNEPIKFQERPVINVADTGMNSTLTPFSSK